MMLEPNTYTKAKEMGAFSHFSLVNRLENSLGMIVSWRGGLEISVMVEGEGWRLLH